MTYTREEVLRACVDYFQGDELAATTWMNKYALKEGEVFYELTPMDMHRRLAKELARIENKYPNPLTEEEIFSKLDGFKYIVPQGGSMAGIGNNRSIQSLSNCFVVGDIDNADSYGSIFKTDQELVQLMKRRGGVGTDLSGLRPSGAKVTNAASTSSGLVSFMERFSNSTREVAQQGRRGALMLSCSILHPDAEMFIDAKVDTTKITGANVSVKITDDFMKCVKHDEPFLQRFPIDATVQDLFGPGEHCVDLTEVPIGELLEGYKSGTYYRWVNAKKLWNKIIHNAWRSAEPGVLFWDTVINESPADQYADKGYTTLSTNPCFTGDTIVAVADGRNGVSIKELAESGEEFPVYSARKNLSYGNRGGNPVTEVKKAIAFKTGTKRIIEVHLSDGSSFKCTPDHRLAVGNLEYVEAKDSLGLTLSKFYTKYKATGFNKYRFINSESCHKQYYYIANYYGLPGYFDGAQIHHINGDSSNDAIDNLCYVDGRTHISQDQLGTNNSVHKINPELFSLLNKRKNILANASRYHWSDEDKHQKLSEFDAKYGVRIEELRGRRVQDEVDTNYEVKVVNITDAGMEDVYDLTVEDNHNFYIITKTWDDKYLNCSGVLVHNCGELPLCPYDSCRLFAINLYSYVINPFTEESIFAYDKFSKDVIMAQRLMDDMVDLEIEKIDEIIEKVKKDPESSEVKSVELNLWIKIRKKCVEGRRTGLGVTAEGDMLAALGLRYGSEDAIKVCTKVHMELAQSSYLSSILLANSRGSFKDYNRKKDITSRFTKRVYESFPESIKEDWITHGRRNIANLTLAPTGTTSLMTQTTSGIEPAFRVIYKRRRKTTDPSKAVFTDANGDMFEEYLVFHHKFVEWYRVASRLKDWSTAFEILSEASEEDIQKVFEASPYYGSTADDIDWVSKVKMQGEIQKWIDHSISCTVNMPKGTTEETVNQVYVTAWESGCKGVTCYVDGSRDGILISTESKQQSAPKQSTKKRPDVIDAQIVRFRNGNENWVAFIGIIDEKPWEIFTGKIDDDIKYLPKSVESGKIARIIDPNDPEKRRYDFIYEIGYGYINALPDIGTAFNPEYYNYARFVSALLQEGTEVDKIVTVVSKLRCGDTINIWNKGVARALKRFISNGTKSAQTCPHCGSTLVYYNGCTTCPGCGQGGKCD